ncbi:GbsR/MarR family transcriptional regulator [Thalassiella azotivora]
MSTDHAEHERLLRAVERLAQALEQTGMPRMAARVFSYVLAEDSDRYTAAELASGLRVSPAAISGAVRYLVQVRMLSKEREPGMRSDLYRVHDDDVWQRIVAGEVEMLHAWTTTLDEVIDLVEPGRAGARRLEETRAFFAFLAEELPAMLEKWGARRAELYG